MPSFRDVLRGGLPQVGLAVMYPSPGVVERIGPDWDWVWIDGQHGQLAYDEMLQMVRACDLVKRPAFVRLPGHEAGPIGLALDMGATGIIIPCVDTPEQARALVTAAKFPPLGNRSYGGRRPIDLRGRTYSDTANSDTLLIVQIESPLAVENAAAIAAIPGIDGLFLGPDDILLRRGVKMDVPRTVELLNPDMQAVINACRKHDKFGVMVAFSAEMQTHCVKLGFHLVVSGGDVPFLANSSKKASEEARATIKSAKAPAAPVGGASASPY